MDDKQEAWTVSKVASFLGIHRVSVYRIPRDKLPYLEHGRRKIRHYDPAIVQAYENGCASPIDESLAGTISSHEKRISELERHLRGKDHESWTDCAGQGD